MTWDDGEHEGCGIDSQRAFEREIEMKDAMDKLADDVKRLTIETCVRVAEIHMREDGISLDGPTYNDAVRQIAAKIRALK